MQQVTDISLSFSIINSSFNVGLSALKLNAAFVPAIHCKFGTKPALQNLHRAFRYYPASIKQLFFNEAFTKVYVDPIQASGYPGRPLLRLQTNSRS